MTMFTPASEAYLYPFLDDVFPAITGFDLQYDIFPMSIEGQSRFFMNLVHGDNVVLEMSIRIQDLVYVKAYKDGTILPQTDYVRSDGVKTRGIDLIQQLEDMLTQMETEYNRIIDVFDDISSPRPTFAPQFVEKPAEPELGIDINAIADRLASRSGRIVASN